MAVTAETTRELQARATPKVLLRLRWRWWRLRTALRMLSPRFRKTWRNTFKTNPHLFNARHHRCFETMSGFYNDCIPGGFMTTAQAERIYNEE